MRVRATCEHCSGTGSRDLTDIEQVTLDAVGFPWRTTSEISDRIPQANLNRTALLNRLADLERLGIVQRSRDLKEHRWRRRRPLTERGP